MKTISILNARYLFRSCVFQFSFLLFSLLSIATSAQYLCAGYAHSFVRCSDQTVQSWGWDYYGQLGNDTLGSRWNPGPVTGLGNVVALGAGDYQSLAVKKDGTIWAWGRNDDGQLGDGSYVHQQNPQQIGSLSGIISAAAGLYHSMALKSDGTVWTWGSNAYGQLGDSSIVSRNIPAIVPNLTGVIAISAGDQHSLALKSDGTIWGWGDNSYGQLGDGTFNSALYPVKMKNLTGAIAAEAGFKHTLALKSDGTVWACGWNQYGQLGIGTKNAEWLPVQVGLSSIVAVAAGEQHSLALKADGTMWSWGDNYYGELGIGTISSDTALPVQVQGIGTNIVNIAASGFHSLVLMTDGSVYSWGYNLYGQLGDSSNQNQSLPVLAKNLCQVASAIAVHPQEGNFSIFPTVSADGAFTITGDTAPDELIVYNITGQLLFKRTSTELPFALRLPVTPGIYIVCVGLHDRIVRKMVCIE